jgi:hypothetical protein
MERRIFRTDLLQRLALNVVSDDYENLEMVRQECLSDAAALGVSFSVQEISTAVRELIMRGLVKAYSLSSREPAREIEGQPADIDMEKLYFFQTNEGKLANATEFWPIGEDGRLLPGVSIDYGERE